MKVDWNRSRLLIMPQRDVMGNFQHLDASKKPLKGFLSEKLFPSKHIEHVGEKIECLRQSDIKFSMLTILLNSLVNLEKTSVNVSRLRINEALFIQSPLHW